MNETLLWVLAFLVSAYYPVKLCWTTVSDEDAWGDKFVALMVSTVFAMIIFIFTFAIVGMTVGAIAYEDYDRSCKKVVNVGGCDKWGDCGVALDKGGFATMKRPVIGEEYCTSKSRYKWRTK